MAYLTSNQKIASSSLVVVGAVKFLKLDEAY